MSSDVNTDLYLDEKLIRELCVILTCTEDLAVFFIIFFYTKSRMNRYDFQEEIGAISWASIPKALATHEEKTKKQNPKS